MRSWIGCSSYSILFLSFLISVAAIPGNARAQSISSRLSYESRFKAANSVSFSDVVMAPDTTQNEDSNGGFPRPKSVMYKSMIIPGWGQIVNKQAWKVPLVYGLLGGLTYYSIYLTKKYHDYRAAYYNLNPNQPNKDFRFGPTPSYISQDANLDQLKTVRNTFRNRRDMVYIGIGLAYGLNIIDAYVFAHMRSFDVSKDLSMRARIQPTVIERATPGVTLSIDFISK